MITTNRFTQGLKNWVVQLLIKATQSVSTERDRLDVLSWLTTVRQILAAPNQTRMDKAKSIYHVSDMRQTTGMVMRSVATSVNNYKNSDLPIALKAALPVTLAAGAVLGGQGVGLAAFGGAIGLPVLLLVFLGTAGVTSVLEAFLSSRDARTYISAVMAVIVQDELYRRATKAMQAAMTKEPIEPEAAAVPKDSEALRQALLTMDPYAFERHVMSFFQQAGLLAWVTKQSNDAGVDGFARHHDGLVVVQCKRYASGNSVGRPVIQQFKGVIEENSAWRGYVVTTSDFTSEARESARQNDRLVLVALDDLVGWHVDGLTMN